MLNDVFFDRRRTKVRRWEKKHQINKNNYIQALTTKLENTDSGVTQGMLNLSFLFLFMFQRLYHRKNKCLCFRRSRGTCQYGGFEQAKRTLPETYSYLRLIIFARIPLVAFAAFCAAFTALKPSLFMMRSASPISSIYSLVKPILNLKIP